MEITVKVLDDTHRRSVKGIFRNTFDRENFTLHDLNTSWYFRHKEESFGFFLPGNIMAGFIITSYHSKNKANLYVDYIAFDPEYRGKGLGSLIMTDFLKKIRALNRSLHLYPERPELWAWYERLGFKETHNGYLNFHSYDMRTRSRV